LFNNVRVINSYIIITIIIIIISISNEKFRKKEKWKDECARKFAEKKIYLLSPKTRDLERFFDPGRASLSSDSKVTC